MSKLEEIEFLETMSPEELEQRKKNDYGTSTWGPWLFWGVALASSIFIWWLVIYDHGVVTHH